MSHRDKMQLKSKEKSENEEHRGVRERANGLLWFYPVQPWGETKGKAQRIKVLLYLAE